MTFTTIPLILISVFILSLYITSNKLEKINFNLNIKAVLISSFLLRIVLSFLFFGHEHPTDINDFSAWSFMLFKNGIGSFYASDCLTDYPPAYMYILYVLGCIRELFSINDIIYFTILKIPSILCDLGISYVVYTISIKSNSQKMSCLISSFFAFSPAVISNSTLWGQVDSIYTLSLLLVLVCIYEKKYIPSFFIYTLSILIKLQSLVIAPIIILSIIDDFFLHGFNAKKIIKHLLLGMSAILFATVLAIPFGLTAVYNQYISTLSSYPYFTVNAFNIWNMLGFNWVETDILNFINFGNSINTDSIISFVILSVICITCVVFFARNKKRDKIFILSAFMYMTTYMFSFRMHERYSFPALALLITYFAINPKENFKYFRVYIIQTALLFLSYSWILLVYNKDIQTYAFCKFQKILSLVNLIAYIDFLLILLKQSGFNLISKKQESVEQSITKLDKKIIIAIACIYSLIAFCGLGSFTAPKTSYTLKDNESVSVSFNSPQKISRVAFYLGPNNLYDKCYLKIKLKCSNGKTFQKSIKDGAVFFWNYDDIDMDVTSATITAFGEDIILFNLSFLDEDSNVVPLNCDSKYSSIFDEGKTVPHESNILNSTYFDEIYHARTAYEFLHGHSVYEWTHPPLGKIIISIGVLIFGMCPFGWRFSGTLFGILMVPIAYIFTKKITKKTWISTIGCILFSFDFMHFVQTRIATIDVYVTFFIMLMYLFMYEYLSIDIFKDKKKSFNALAYCGISFGLGVACKWTAVYAGAGLALIWLAKLISSYRKSDMESKSKNKQVFNIFIISTVFFVIVPMIIYAISYIPYMICENNYGLGAIISNQNMMFTYHSKTVVNSTHPYSSHWYQWPVMARPIWYYSHTYSDTVKAGVSAFGNPAVWWIAISAIFVNIYLAIKKDKNALFLLVAYLSQLLPWIPISRTTYIYHYFPTVIFQVLLICNVISVAYEQTYNKVLFKKISFAYTAIAIILFIIFYPVLSGMPIYTDYVETFLRWFSTWVLI